MITRRALALGSAVLGMVLAAGAQAAGDAAAGHYKAQTCLGCHAIPNYEYPYPMFNVPKLGGQHAKYIVSALEEYKSGKRSNPTMQAQANSLSKQDMENVAAYFASLAPNQ